MRSCRNRNVDATLATTISLQLFSVLAICLLTLSSTTTTTKTTTTTFFTMALASPSNSNPSSQKKYRVIVSGAGGQTGQSLFRQMLNDENKHDFEPLGLVRSNKSKQTLIDSGIPSDSIAVCDVTDRQQVQSVVDTFTCNGEKPLDAFCIATSAKPQPTSETNPDTGRPIFDFPTNGGQPEIVDWIGQQNQIDVCPDGCHVVLCSTMGGSDPNHPLNNLGRKINPETGEEMGGNIVKWKRKSEMYLIEQSPRLIYTIIHPGGLVNEPMGQRTLVVGVDDDTSWPTTTLTESRTVPRDDVAKVMLESVRRPTIFGGRSFDLRAKSIEECSSTTTTITTDFDHLLDPLEGKNCDYTLGAIM